MEIRLEVSIAIYSSHHQNYFRFGTSIRKEGKPKTTYYERDKVYTKLEAPGPGGHDIKSYTDAGVKVLLQKRLTETEIKEFRQNLNRKGEGLGPGQYNAQLP